MDRDEQGRFAQGNKGGPGRPKKARETRYYEIAMSAVTFGDWKTIIQKAGKQAKAGDAIARRFLADYLLGKPQQFIDLTSGGEKLPGVMVYLPEIDGEVETEQRTAGEIPPE